MILQTHHSSYVTSNSSKMDSVAHPLTINDPFAKAFLPQHLALLFSLELLEGEVEHSPHHALLRPGDAIVIILQREITAPR